MSRQELDQVRTSHAILFGGVQDTVGVDAFLQVCMGLLAKLSVLEADLAHEIEVLLELLASLQMVVVELHAGDVWVFGGTEAERAHSAAVDIESAVGEEVEEQTIVWLFGVGDVLGEVLEILD